MGRVEWEGVSSFLTLSLETLSSFFFRVQMYHYIHLPLRYDLRIGKEQVRNNRSTNSITPIEEDCRTRKGQVDLPFCTNETRNAWRMRYILDNSTS